MLLRMLALLFVTLMGSASSMAANVSFIMGILGPDVKDAAVRDMLSMYDVTPVTVDVKSPFALIKLTPAYAEIFERDARAIPIADETVYSHRLAFEAASIGNVDQFGNGYLLDITTTDGEGKSIIVDRCLLSATQVPSFSENPMACCDCIEACCEMIATCLGFPGL